MIIIIIIVIIAVNEVYPQIQTLDPAGTTFFSCPPEVLLNQTSGGASKSCDSNSNTNNSIY